MTAQATTKLQVNYKLADGTLINVYGDDVKDLEAQLNGLNEVAPLIASTSSAFGLRSAVATVTSVLGATPIDSASVNAAVISVCCVS